MLIRCGSLVLVMGFLIPVAAQSQPKPDINEDEQLLTTAGLKTDGPGLLEFFRKRTLTEAEVKNLAQLIPQLGDNDFTKRQQASDKLAAAGPPILPHLRLALDDPDQEIQRRLKECIETIENGPGAARAIAAARLLQAKRPKEACEVLIAFLPFADNENVKEAVVSSVMALGVRDKKVDETVVKSLGDKTPVKRATAALVIGRSGTDEQRNTVKKLLTDSSWEVRLGAAQGLAAARDKSVAPTLISLLVDAPAAAAEQAEDLLERMAGEKAPTLRWEESKKQVCRDAWEAWWKSDGEKLDLAKADVDPLTRSPLNQTRQVTQFFFDAMFKGKTVDFTKITEVPFYVSDHETFKTHEELNKEFSKEAQNAVRDKIQFEMKGIMPVSEYAKREKSNKKFLDKIDKRQVFVALMMIKAANQEIDFATFVRVSGGKAKIIGLAEANDGGRR